MPRSKGMGWAAATGVLWGLSYFFWRHLQATPVSAGIAAYPQGS